MRLSAFSPPAERREGGRVRKQGESETAPRNDWQPAMVTTLLNASTGREEPSLCAAACCVATCRSAAAPSGALGPSIVEGLVQQPINGFALEMVCLHSTRLTAAHCSYWALVLEEVPPWTPLFFSRKQPALRQLALRLVQASPFSPHHLRLLRALHNVRGLSTAIVGEAVELLQFRVNEPSAGRWQMQGGVEDAAVDGARRYETPSGFVRVGREQLLAPTRLLLELPVDEVNQGETQIATGAPAGEASLVRDALELLTATG